MVCMFASIRPVLFVLIFSCLTLLGSATAFAANDKAIEFYEQAQVAYGNKNYKEAADLLEKAFAQEPDLIYMYNRILALRAAGDSVESLRLLNLYEDPMIGDKQKRFSASELGQVRQALEAEAKKATEPKPDPKPDPVVTPDPDNTVVVKDPDDGKVKDPGAVTTNTPSNTVPYVLWGLGGASLVGGVLFGTGAFLPSDDDLNTQEKNDEYNSVLATQKVLTGGLLGVGVVLGVVGVVLYDSGGSDATSVRLAPTSNGARVSVRF
jgi:tetratricopeptide (TPR) repeat protein